jgi:hypothetical protein
LTPDVYHAVKGRGEQMITEFKICVAHTVNLGNFESMKVEASVTVAVPEDGDFPSLKLKAQNELRVLARETFIAQRKSKKEVTA